MGCRIKENTNVTANDASTNHASRHDCRTEGPWHSSDLVELGGVIGGLIEGPNVLCRGSRFLGLVWENYAGPSD